MRTIPVTTYFLEMHDPRQLRPKATTRREVAVVKVDPPLPALNRFFYATVGNDWFWIDRLAWTYQQWLLYLQQAGLETWLLTVSGIPAGYCELKPNSEQHVQIAYFGLLPQFIGGGLGGYFLTRMIERGWGMGAKRVWVHTCSLDHPCALTNYQARGLHLYREETTSQSIPLGPFGPWPGAFPDRQP